MSNRAPKEPTPEPAPPSCNKQGSSCFWVWGTDRWALVIDHDLPCPVHHKGL